MRFPLRVPFKGFIVAFQGLGFRVEVSFKGSFKGFIVAFQGLGFRVEVSFKGSF